MKNRRLSYIVYFSFIALIIAFCTQAGQWVLDGRKVLVVDDPDGLRLQLGAVANASGTASNLTVYDTLRVSGVGNSIPAVISGTDAGDYAGAYTYAGTDAEFGEYFTNAFGRVLFHDIYSYLGGGWLLDESLDGFGIYGGSSSMWYEGSTLMVVDIVMTGQPSYAVTGGDLHAQGSVIAEGFFIAIAESSAESRYCFGSNSWLYVSGTNLMFRNSAGNIGTVNITY
jgi:hypothetical protein